MVPYINGPPCLYNQPLTYAGSPPSSPPVPPTPHTHWNLSPYHLKPPCAPVRHKQMGGRLYRLLAQTQLKQKVKTRRSQAAPSGFIHHCALE